MSTSFRAGDDPLKVETLFRIARQLRENGVERATFDLQDLMAAADERVALLDVAEAAQEVVESSMPYPHTITAVGVLSIEFRRLQAALGKIPQQYARRTDG